MLGVGRTEPGFGGYLPALCVLRPTTRPKECWLLVLLSSPQWAWTSSWLFSNLAPAQLSCGAVHYYCLSVCVVLIVLRHPCTPHGGIYIYIYIFIIYIYHIYIERSVAPNRTLSFSQGCTLLVYFTSVGKLPVRGCCGNNTIVMLFMSCYAININTHRLCHSFLVWRNWQYGLLFIMGITRCASMSYYLIRSVPLCLVL